MKIDYHKERISFTPESAAEIFQLEWLAERLEADKLCVTINRQWSIQEILVKIEKKT